ncbi:MAG: hypothetical protein CM15mP102_11140 [Flavobacteriales bacterium]|nr:MAG: hypothetical protein CM15mP102_11140 [Flavobacteriales bacterium]
MASLIDKRLTSRSSTLSMSNIFALSLLALDLSVCVSKKIPSIPLTIPALAVIQYILDFLL